MYRGSGACRRETLGLKWMEVPAPHRLPQHGPLRPHCNFISRCGGQWVSHQHIIPPRWVTPPSQHVHMHTDFMQTKINLCTSPAFVHSFFRTLFFFDSSVPLLGFSSPAPSLGKSKEQDFFWGFPCLPILDHGCWRGGHHEGRRMETALIYGISFEGFSFLLYK